MTSFSHEEIPCCYLSFICRYATLCFAMFRVESLQVSGSCGTFVSISKNHYLYVGYSLQDEEYELDVEFSLMHKSAISFAHLLGSSPPYPIVEKILSLSFQS